MVLWVGAGVVCLSGVRFIIIVHIFDHSFSPGRITQTLKQKARARDRSFVIYGDRSLSYVAIFIHE